VTKSPETCQKSVEDIFWGSQIKIMSVIQDFKADAMLKNIFFLLQIALEMKAIDLNVPKVNISGAWSDA
jgi:hypothetical protein